MKHRLLINSSLIAVLAAACTPSVPRPTFASKTQGADANPETGYDDDDDNDSGQDIEDGSGEGSDLDTGAGNENGGGTGEMTPPDTTTNPETPPKETEKPKEEEKPNDGTPVIGTMDASGYKLVWKDEFNGDKVDPANWVFEVQKPRWVNDELQNYTNNRKENTRVENGHLIIEARRDNFEGHEYSSGRIKTQGKQAWKYGKIEARIQLPGGLGTWPAFWMMPENQSRGWPACGEIDIMEQVGFETDTTHATTHTLMYNWQNNNVKTAHTVQKGITSGFHTYTVIWVPGKMEMQVDGRTYYSVSDEGKGDDAWPFNKEFHIILNLAVGGVWGGMKGVDPNIWPRQMKVDWVRVWQK